MSGYLSEIKQEADHLEGGKSEEIEVKLEAADDCIQLKSDPEYVKSLIKTEPELILEVPEDILPIKEEAEDSDTEDLEPLKQEVIEVKAEVEDLDYTYLCLYRLAPKYAPLRLLRGNLILSKELPINIRPEMLPGGTGAKIYVFRR